jgi:site-specific DNA-methyltransferase (adenine-specific)
MEYKINYKGYELIIEQNEDGSFNIPDTIKDIEGFGTAAKPANEPICVARKPLSEKSVAENVLKWGTGGINVDGCRVGSEVRNNGSSLRDIRGNGLDAEVSSKRERLEREDSIVEGRFPANIILECLCDEVIKGETNEKKIRGKLNDHKESSVFGIGGVGVENYDYNDKGDIHTNPMCPCRLLDEQSGISKSSPRVAPKESIKDPSSYNTGVGGNSNLSDKGGASRFFYQAKVSKSERNMGLDEFEKTTTGGKGHGLDRRCSHCNTSMLKPEDCKCEEPDWITPAKKNSHPTVKPVSLMAYLCRLVTPPNGIVLDPFMGSGSTGIAARLEGFKFCGMEMDKDYFKIAEARIENFEEYRKFLK